ncbi:MAG TPA: PAS domain S-box protein, partial [Candidatus Polarisedimenticolia bacterium]|nr:PAS domain S-box protein [Candidatus Polarisedimenticolia bacterium]
SAVEQTADAILITDRNGLVEYVNPAFEKMTGFSAAEVLGKKPSILKSDKTNPQIFSRLWATILSGKPFHALFVNRKKSGELYYEDKTISPLKDAQGEITHFVSAGRDTTERKKAEEQERLLLAAIESAAMEWKLTFDAVESAIIVTDSDGNIRRLNQTAKNLTELSYGDIVERNIRDFAQAEPWHTIAQLIIRTRESRQPALRQIRDASTGRSWDLNIAAFNHPGQGREMMIITARDVTQIAELQESLRKSETMSAMGTLVAGVAHEVRNPLFSISATLDAFEARFGLRAEYQEHIRILRQELERLNALMGELLDYGKPASLNLTDNAIAPIVEAAVGACETLASKAGVNIVRQIAPSLPQLRCDRRRLVEVFRNLLENAIQHSGRGGRISVEARTLQEDQEVWIECSVKDSGPGFRAEDLPHVFEPFFSRRRGGTGLGLAIVDRIVEQHGGKIVAQNRAEGGAEVSIRLRANGSS